MCVSSAQVPFGSQTWRPTKRTLTYMFPILRGSISTLGEKVVSCSWNVSAMRRQNSWKSAVSLGVLLPAHLRNLLCGHSHLFQTASLKNRGIQLLPFTCPNLTFLPFGVLVGPFLVAAPKGALAFWGTQTIAAATRTLQGTREALPAAPPEEAGTSGRGRDLSRRIQS